MKENWKQQSRMNESMEKVRPNNNYPQVVNSLYSERQSSAPPMYPTISSSDPHISNPSSSSSSSLYPTIDMDDLLVNLFPDHHPSQTAPPTAPPIPNESVEELLLNVPGAILHLIDKQYSVELASGHLSIVCLRQGNDMLAVFARIANEIEWPLFKDTPSVKLDDSHYFFSLRFPKDKISSSSSDDEDNDHRNEKHNSGNEPEFLNYGVTIASKGQENLLKQLDQLLGLYTAFSLQKVSAKNSEALDAKLAKEISPSEMKSEEKKEIMEEKSTAYWTTLAPNVEDYSGSVAKGIALGSGKLIQGILWCGDVTVDRLKWGDEFLRKRMDPCQKDSEVSPETLKRIKRVKRMTKMSQKVATGVLSGVVKVSGYVTSSVVNSKAGKKFFNLLPGEIVLATLDGFGKVCDAVEVAGKNVMSTTSTVTTGLVSHRHGEKAAAAAHEGMDAAGHAVGTAWAVFKIRQALNPKSAIKPTSLGKAAAKAAAAEVKKKNKKK